MTKTKPDFPIPPLSERDHPYALERGYDDTRLHERQVAGDQALLIRLERECCADPRTMFHGAPVSGCKAPRVTVSSLGDDVLQRAVEEVRMLHPHWRLAGNETQRILYRLDEHFRPLQEAWRARRIEQEEQNQRRARESAELDRDLAAAAERQTRAIWGLPAA